MAVLVPPPRVRQPSIQHTSVVTNVVTQGLITVHLKEGKGRGREEEGGKEEKRRWGGKGKGEER